MSDLAIVAASSALRSLLTEQIQAGQNPISGAQVTALPLDKAQESTGKRLNLFLYSIAINGTWRNMDLPTWNKVGGEGSPPLAVDLYYLLTAYDQSGDEANLTSQHLLGRAMQILKDNPLLNPAPHEQIECIRITPQPLSFDEMSKLWTTFQTQYRTSVAYQVSVILIESQKDSPTPLPVLQRGPNDQGIISQPNLIPPVPTLTKIILPDKQPGLHLGDEWVIEGYHLVQENKLTEVHLMHPRLDNPIEMSKLRNQTSTQLTLNLEDEPDAKSKFPPGLYRLGVILSSTEGGQSVTQATNELPLPLAPKITLLEFDSTDNSLTVTCEPDLMPGQQVTLFVGSKAFSSFSFATNPDRRDKLIFTIDVTPGKYLVRLRVDGVDSMPVSDYAAIPLTFDEAQMVIINE